MLTAFFNKDILKNTAGPGVKREQKGIQD